MFGRKADIRDEIIRQQAVQIADLMDRLQEMIGQVHLHQVQQATAAAEQARMFVSEEEEDLRLQHTAGLLDREALERALQELDFANSDIIGN